MPIAKGSTDGANTQGLKALFHGFKDLQQLRIQQGNRLCANFYSRLGVDPGTSPDKLAGKNATIIKKVRIDYEKITDKILEQKKKRPNMIKVMQTVGTELINSNVDLSLTKSYLDFLKKEKETKSDIEKELQNFDLWNLYLEHVSGIGPAIAGGIVAYLDIRKARYVSSFHKYCGLDAIPFTEEPDKEFRLILDEAWPVKGGTKGADRYRLDPDEGEEMKLPILEHEFTFKKGSREVICDSRDAYDMFEVDDIICTVRGKRNNGQKIIKKTDEPRPRGVKGEGRGRLKHHLVEREYEDKDGKIAKKMGLSFNPRAKTLFVGIMPDVLLKQNKHYNSKYWGYKNRIINDPARHHEGEHILASGHITMMARRYMAKIFLQNLWVAWKQIEGLPMLKGPYQVEKLGLEAHPDPWFDPKVWQSSGGKKCFDVKTMKLMIASYDDV